MTQPAFEKRRSGVSALVVGQLSTNCYLLFDQPTRKLMIVDPGDDADYIAETITKLGAVPTLIVATHGHFDHIMAAWQLQQMYQLPFVIHGKDVFLVERMRQTAQYFLKAPVTDPSPLVSQTVDNGHTLRLGDTVWKVMHTPGHTPGSISLYSAKCGVLICGDVIFADGGVGRTDFSYSNQKHLQDSVGKILSLPPQTVILPGHGDATTVTAEKRFSGRFASRS